MRSSAFLSSRLRRCDEGILSDGQMRAQLFEDLWADPVNALQVCGGVEGTLLLAIVDNSPGEGVADSVELRQFVDSCLVDVDPVVSSTFRQAIESTWRRRNQC